MLRLLCLANLSPPARSRNRPSFPPLLPPQMEASWLGFVAKYCGGEVGVLRASGAGGRTTALLELRPFTLDAAAAGGTAPLRPALTQECAQFFGPAGHCRHGDRCGFAHTPARSWADPVAGSR